MFYVVTYKGPEDDNVRVMGFCCDKHDALRLVAIFGQGADYEQIVGPYPTDELSAALAYEEHKRRHGLKLVREAV